MSWRFFATFSIGIGILGGCGDDSSCESCPGTGGASASGSSTGGGACTLTTGELHGTVTLFEPPGGPNSLPAPGALLDLRQKPDDVPTHAMADAQANYSVELPAGSWIVGGENADGTCKTFMPKTVSLEACGSTQLDVVLEVCVN